MTSERRRGCSAKEGVPEFRDGWTGWIVLCLQLSATIIVKIKDMAESISVQLGEAERGLRVDQIGVLRMLCVRCLSLLGCFYLNSVSVDVFGRGRTR